jgi:hypothetical protein
MNVLIIPEDFRKDQYVLKPLVVSMLAALGKPNAKVRVLTDPLLGGIDKALDLQTLRSEVLGRYKGMVQLFLLLVDRDGNPGRRHALSNLEQALRLELAQGKAFLGECAFQEIEVWALAGADLPTDWAWSEVRAHVHPKEAFFQPLAKAMAVADEPGEGRDTLGAEAARQLPRVMRLCPELAHLSSRLSAYLTGSAACGEPFDG